MATTRPTAEDMKELQQRIVALQDSKTRLISHIRHQRQQVRVLELYVLSQALKDAMVWERAEANTQRQNVQDGDSYAR